MQCIHKHLYGTYRHTDTHTQTHTLCARSAAFLFAPGMCAHQRVITASSSVRRPRFSTHKSIYAMHIGTHNEAHAHAQAPLCSANKTADRTNIYVVHIPH